MRRAILWMGALALSGCSLFHRGYRPEHAPKAEADALPYPLGFPSSGQVQVPAEMAAAISLALDDILPRDVAPPRNATADDVCLYRRDSYDVDAAPLNADVMLVRFRVRAGACNAEGRTVTEVATYAVDVRRGRILVVQE
ncbi:hypothetical protein JGU66_08555 [Myxococcaceae bacterium JPH2]|nr:hypothetical protein [Myxococcaceae bacterium JPH2]